MKKVFSVELTGMNLDGIEDEVRIPINQQNQQEQQQPLTKASVLSKGRAAHISIEDTAKILQTSPTNGLSNEEAERRLKKYGPNALPEEKPLSLWKIFLKQFYDFMVLILLVAGIVSIVLGDYIESGVLFAVVAANVIIGFVQESKAEKALAALKQLTVPKATVTRDGDSHVIDAQDLVVGDVVCLEEGNRVPADIRLIEAVNLQATEAILTGESEPVDKDNETIPKAKKKKPVPVHDRHNMVFMSTAITRGHGKGIVVATGKLSEVGQISKALGSRGGIHKTTPLQARLNKLGKILVVVSIVLCAIVIGIQLIKLYVHKGSVTGGKILQFVKVGVSLAVSVIPEGLVAVVTVTMALGVQRMAKRKAVVRKLSAVETLGSVTALCSDKTGTLTEGKMKAEEFWFANEDWYGVTGSGIVPEGQFTSHGKEDEPVEKLPKQLRMILVDSALCNNSSVQRNEEKDEWESLGDPTEVALQVAAQKVVLDKDSLTENSKWEFKKEAGFDSERKRMTVLYKVPSNEEAFQNIYGAALTKGALEMLLKICNTVQVGEEPKPLDESLTKKIQKQSEIMASKGLRVLAMAYKTLDQGALEAVQNADELEREMTFLGLVGLRDPPREQAIDAIKQLKSAGVEVYMITGDHPRTAVAIASHLGIISEKELKEGEESKYVIEGSQIDSMDRGALAKLKPFPKVFARITPQDKLKIVDALHIRGDVTSMIGDGVNDAPALKHCDVGVSMGKSGTDLAQQSAAVILMDDNIATLVAALEEGRRTFDNIQKFILYLLSCNSSEIYVMLLAVAIGLPTPFTAVMILWANLIVDVPPAMALGIDPAEPDVLARKPRHPKAGVFNWKSIGVVLYQGFIMAGLTLGLYATTIYAEGYDEPVEIGEKGASKSNRARGLAFVNLAVLHCLHAFLARSVKRSVFSKTTFNNKWLNAGVLFSIFFIVVVCYIPGLNFVLNQWPLNWVDWLHIGACVVAHITLVEIQKAFLRWYENRYERATQHHDIV